MAASSMAFTFIKILPILLISFSSLSSPTTNALNSKITSSYIIHVDHSLKPLPFETHKQWYSSMLSSSSEDRILYTYATAAHGFSAKLTQEEAQTISASHGVLSVHKDRLRKPHTTRSPDFLGLTTAYGILPSTDSGDGVVIGFIDTGVRPESASFRDAGLSPLGVGWRGACAEGAGFCNNKIVGARFFLAGYEALCGPLIPTRDFRSARDNNGHGSHVSSIAAGAPVAGAHAFGFANGTARGMAPKARVAMYKACWYLGCTDSDLLAAIEYAIKDGVHVLSLSLGVRVDFLNDDVITVGAFSASQRGIIVACSAGNSGPVPTSVENYSPWTLTVGAATLDRTFPAWVRMGNGEVILGESISASTPTLNRRALPLARVTCPNFRWDEVPRNVSGKVVACESPFIEGVYRLQKAGAVGVIGFNRVYDGETTHVEPHTLPAIAIGYREGLRILAYLNSTDNPTVELVFSNRTIIGQRRAPVVASFSARGPNHLAPELLKPDVVAPGVNVLAAWSPRPTTIRKDRRRVDYNIASGTSMSCPHAAGIAALVRAAHPNWSEAAVRSALMTTAYAVDKDYRPIAEGERGADATALDFGAGHVNPLKAGDPGLVYDMGARDYVDFLCTLNYTDAQIRAFTKGPYECSRLDGGVGGINYPSFSVLFDITSSNVQVLKRTVTFVGGVAPEEYNVTVVNPRPDKAEITVEPGRLVFGEVGEKKSYWVVFKNKVEEERKTEEGMEFGYVIWESEVHYVKSSVALAWNKPEIV
ncbi:Subtilisin-like protease [Acorus calamus]|uniref:Subtilisin-like protease n=1 Tax=Acorus calamus TaxID=4465 RepID=A0AAV9CAC7_ACOCL|nr:Subtilisin-like protease [Acorus calamus]